MKLLLPIVLLLWACSPSKTSCIDLTGFQRTEWISANSTLSYFVCKDGDVQMSREDSFTLSFLGTLNQEQLLSKGALDSLIFSSIYGLRDGKYSMADESVNTSLIEAVSKLKRKAVVYMRFMLSDSAFAEPEPKIVLYFKSDIDSATAINWLRDKQARFIQIEKTVYVSKEKAKEQYLKEGNEDWSNILESNPLPSSAEIYVRRDTALGTIDSLVNAFSGDPIVSTLESRQGSIFPEAGSVLQTPFVIRVVTN